MARYFLHASVMLLLGGCLPFPHMAQRSVGVEGRVIDASTRKPVAEATVEFVDHPALAAVTDGQGGFTIRETKRVEPFISLLVHGEDFAVGKSYSPVLRISRKGYRPLKLNAHDESRVDYGRYDPKPVNSYWIKDTIFLKPIPLHSSTR